MCIRDRVEPVEGSLEGEFLELLGPAGGELREPGPLDLTIFLGEPWIRFIFWLLAPLILRGGRPLPLFVCFPASTAAACVASMCAGSKVPWETVTTEELGGGGAAATAASII